MRICCISDTHERQDHMLIPYCDLLIHAGDITMGGKPRALADFNRWCERLLEEKVVRQIVTIAGNHDFLFQTDPEQARKILTASIYLEDSGFTCKNLRFWGTPWQPWFYDWAFNLRTEEELAAKFASIPEGTDVLISHGPPKNILDRTTRGETVGSSALRKRIFEIHPKLVVFGHIHESYGIVEQEGITFVNASNCDVHYDLTNQPIMVEL